MPSGGRGLGSESGSGPGGGTGSGGTGGAGSGGSGAAGPVFVPYLESEVGVGGRY